MIERLLRQKMDRSVFGARAVQAGTETPNHLGLSNVNGRYRKERVRVETQARHGTLPVIHQ